MRLLTVYYRNTPTFHKQPEEFRHKGLTVSTAGSFMRIRFGESVYADEVFIPSDLIQSAELVNNHEE